MPPQIIPIEDVGSKARRRVPAVITVPGERVSAVPAAVPDGVPDRVARSIVFGAVTDWIGTAAEGGPEGKSESGTAVAPHLVLLPGKGRDRTVLVASKAEVSAWQARLATHHVQAAVLPDYLCLPWAPGVLTLVAAGNRLLVRYGAARGFSAETPLSLALLERLVATPDLVLREIWITPQTPQLAAHAARLAAALAPDEPSRDGLKDAPQTSHPRPAIVPIGQAHPPTPAPGSLIARQSWAGMNGWGGLRMVALALWLAAGLLWTGGIWQDARRLEATETALRQEIQIEARGVFGITGPILDLRVQIARRRAALAADAGTEEITATFAELLSRAGPVLVRETDEISALYYDGTRLRIAVRLPGFGAFDELQRGLARAGLTARLHRAVLDRGDGVDAEMDVSFGATRTER